MSRAGAQSCCRSSTACVDEDLLGCAAYCGAEPIRTSEVTLLQVTVISRGRPELLPEEHGSCTFQHVDGSTTTSASYAAAGLASADAVIIGAHFRPADLTHELRRRGRAL